MGDNTVESASGSERGARWTTTDLQLLVAITVLAAGVRLIGIELWSWSLAETGTWRALTQPLGGADGFFFSERLRHPAVFLSLRGLLHTGLLPGYTEGWLRLPFAFAGALAPALVAMLARRWLGRGVACMAAVLLAIHPTHTAASQTAEPVVVAVTAALAAGTLAARGTRWGHWPVVVLAGLCHPIGWPLALVLVFAALPPGALLAVHRDRFSRWLPAWLWPVGVVAAAPLLPTWCGQVGLPVVVTALVAIVLAPGVGRVFAAVGLLPLALGGLYALAGFSGERAAVLATLPPTALLCALGVVRYFVLVRDLLPTSRQLATAVAAAPGLVVAGELLTALFLYATLFAGGRPPWRDVADFALGTMQRGQNLHVVAVSGTEVLRSYLRPNHWQGTVGDPHPGICVDALPLPNDRGLGSELLADPAVLVALTGNERAALLRHERWGPMLSEFEVQSLWPFPQPGGDNPLYLLQRPRRD